MTHSLDPMLRPQSVAIIGASDAIERIGGRPIHSMKNGNFQGRIYAVNPNRETVQGLPAYASINDVPEVVDCVIIAVPAQVVIATLKDCVAQGAKSAVIFSSGFAEMSECIGMNDERQTTGRACAVQGLARPPHNEVLLRFSVLDNHARFLGIFIGASIEVG